jgi:hypothetical protein
MASTQTNFPVTHKWLEQWQWNSVSTNTEFGLTLNSVDFTIAPVQSGYGQQGNMSTKKQVKSGATTYWFGWSTQVNFKTALANGNILQNWMSINGIDQQQPTNFVNFLC